MEDKQVKKKRKLEEGKDEKNLLLHCKMENLEMKTGK